MRIGFLTLEYPPAGGGIASSLATLAPALAKRGHAVSVVGWADQARRETVDGVSVDLIARTRLPKLGWWLNPSKVDRQLRLRVERGELDVLVAHDWCGPSASVAPGCPVVIWCHGSATYFDELTGEGLRSRVSRAERRALQQATSVAAVSRYTAERTGELFALKKVPGVLHNAVDVERFVPTDDVEIETDMLLYVGTIVRKKGVLGLSRAFNRVVAKRPDVRLVVAGRDSRDAATGAPSTWKLCLDSLSDEARSRVDYRGFIPYAEIERLIRSCLAAVLPSTAEALPLAWMEVMACARPVIAAEVGWAPELVTDGVDGLLVQASNDVMLAEAMVRLLDQPEEANRFGHLARERMVADFAPDHIAQQCEQWLEEVIQRSGVSR